MLSNLSHTLKKVTGEYKQHTLPRGLAVGRGGAVVRERGLGLSFEWVGLFEYSTLQTLSASTSMFKE